MLERSVGLEPTLSAAALASGVPRPMLPTLVKTGGEGRHWLRGWGFLCWHSQTWFTLRLPAAEI